MSKHDNAIGFVVEALTITGGEPGIRLGWFVQGIPRISVRRNKTCRQGM